MILNRSTGFIALMRFLQDVYIHFNRIGEVIEATEFLTIFKRINIKEEDFNRTNYIPGSGGQSELYNHLKEKSGL
jgi:hypothetical protein